MMQGNEKWRPLTTATSPSARLRAARTMPQWMQSRGSALLPPPPPPPEDPPPMEPDYEVIEFPGQQTYTNAPLQRNLADGKQKSDGKRCDLCGSSAPAVRCTQCNQQTFCISCDDMYHRHPKRQTHVRKELGEPSRTGKQMQPNRPPLPPKGESSPAPIPPPRRNKRFVTQRPSTSINQVEAPKVGLVGSLKRLMSPRELPNVPLSVPHSSIEFQEHINPMHISRENGINDWQLFRGNRSGSFSTLNGPGFPPIMQAQSMAQLNCPSCQHGVMWNEWGPRGPPMSPWGGMPPSGAWNSSGWLNQPLRREHSHGSSRRGSLRGRPRETESSGSEEDERMSTRGGRRRNVVSPALSHRRRHTMPSDFESEDEDEEEGEEDNDRKTWRNPSKQTTHNVSPVQGTNMRIPRRASLMEGNARPYRQRDEDALSTHGGRRYSSTLSRKGQKDIFDSMMNQRISRKNDLETLSNHSTRKYNHEQENILRNRRHDFDGNSSSRGESYGEESSIRGNQRASDLEDNFFARRKSEINSLAIKKENQENTTIRKKNKRNERFTDTGRRRSSPVSYRSDNRGDRSSDSIEDNSQKEPAMSMQEKNGETGDGDNEEEGELGPVPDTEWNCVHCTFVNEPGTRVCAVCCKTTLKPKPKQPEQPQKRNNEKLDLSQELKRMSVEEPKPVTEPSKSPTNQKRGFQEISEPNRTLTSKGTSPPPQSISTQTYDVTGHKLKRATSLADYDWKTPQRSHSRQSLLSDTQSLPVTPPKGRSPDRYSQSEIGTNLAAAAQRKSSEPIGLTSQRNTKRAGSQPPDYISTLVQKQVKQGLEMVKLLREAEEHQFSADDLAVALTHCEDEDPIVWLQLNWRNMIDTVVTLATNYGHERKENTVGTISASEARDALRLHDGNVWAAVTECVDQRQRKYTELLSRGNFSREDIVTMLTAHHGNVEAAYTELNKSQLKPFLMRIWGPPPLKGADNDSAEFTKLAHDDDSGMGRGGGGGKSFGEVSSYNSELDDDRIHNWLENQIYKPKNLSQSMMHLNLIGQFDKDDRYTSSIDLKQKQGNTKTNTNNTSNRRSSDVHRYLENYYRANDNSLEMKSKYTSMINLNKNLNFNEQDLAGKHRVIEALKISNSHKNNINISISGIEDYLSKMGSSSSVSRDFYGDQQDFIDYENVQIVNHSGDETGDRDEENNSVSNDNEQISEELINEIYALRHVKRQSKQINDSVEEDLVRSAISSSESYESLSPADEVNDQQQNLSDEEITLKVEKRQLNGIEKDGDQQYEEKEESMEELRETRWLSGNILKATDDKIELPLEINQIEAEASNLALPPGMDTHVTKDDKDKAEPTTESETDTENGIQDDGGEKEAGKLLLKSDNVRTKYETNTTEEHRMNGKDNRDEDETNQKQNGSYNINQTAQQVKNESSSKNVQSLQEKDNINETSSQVLHKNVLGNIESESNEMDEHKFAEENSNVIVKDKAVGGNQHDERNRNTSNDNGYHELRVSGIAELNDNSSWNSPVTVINKKSVHEDKSQMQTISDGNSDKDISSLPTDSERDISSISEDSVIKTDDTKVDLERGKKQDNQELVRPQFENNDTASNQLLHLLKESLSKEDVVERIVSTLFQTVLRASVDLQIANETDTRILQRKKTDSDTSSNFHSESEETSDSYFYEAEDPENSENLKKVAATSVGTKKKSITSRHKKAEKVQEKIEKHNDEIHEIREVNTENITTFQENETKVVLTDKEVHEREVRRVLGEGLVDEYDQAELAVQLMEMKFDLQQSVSAAKECTSLHAAVTFLQQECYLCAGKYTMKQMISMLECDHRCCMECAKNYFTLQITERSINDCICPFCKEPDLLRLEEDQALDYFSNLDIFLKAIVTEKVHELFQRKLRDRTLMQDPNFKWCIKCSSGFIANPHQTRLICPDCKTITCAKCGKPWEKEHDKMSCEEYAEWKEYNDPENQLARHLEENGVTCPKCNNRYVLAKGGCMHLTCPQCKYEFCSGCAKQFLMGSKCKVSDNCERLGLHSHHPRNCLFYLRDKEPAILRKLLDDNGIEYKRNEDNLSTRCRIQLLRETDDGLVEAVCGYPIEDQGLCRIHFIEHLVTVIRHHKIDPATSLDLTEAQQELRRHGKTLPTRADGTTDRVYLDTCVKMILEEIPLE